MSDIHLPEDPDPEDLEGPPITRAMVEAGAELLRYYDPVGDDPDDEVWLIFRAMWAARPRNWPDV